MGTPPRNCKSAPLGRPELGREAKLEMKNSFDTMPAADGLSFKSSAELFSCDQLSGQSTVERSQNHSEYGMEDDCASAGPKAVWNEKL